MRVLLLTPLLATGCLAVTTRPACETVDVVELADDEPSPMGTADELLDEVERAEQRTAEWWDGRGAKIELLLVRGDGPAEWVTVEETVEKTRHWGIGVFQLQPLVSCDDRLQVPLEGYLKALDGALDVPVSGHALAIENRFDLQRATVVDLDGRFRDATFPDSDEDPADYTGKDTFVSLEMPDGGEIMQGSAGWSGTQETPDRVTHHAERVVTWRVGTP